MSRLVEVWTFRLDKVTQGQEEEVQTGVLLHNIKLAADFLAEAAIETIKLQVRIMMASVTARHALWLHLWIANLASKSGSRYRSLALLCSVRSWKRPFPRLLAGDLALLHKTRDCCATVNR